MSEAARPRGLGRGLSALLGENYGQDLARPVPAAPAAPAEPIPHPSNVAPTPFPSLYTPAPEPAAEPAAGPLSEAGPRTVPIEHLQRNPNQPRRHFDETELAELADSIRTHGVLQPILVRPVKDQFGMGQAGRYEIVAGERRWRAAQMAGVASMPVVVRELDEVEVLEIGIIENVQRADLNPIEEAQGYQALIERFHRTQQDIADVVGKSRPHIANMMRLLQLPAEIQDMVKDGRLSAGHARAVLTAPDPMALARIAVAQGLNVREIEKLAGQAKELKAPKPAAEKDADTRAMEASLSTALGLSVLITGKGDQPGELRISYKTLEQLDDLCRRLSR